MESEAGCESGAGGGLFGAGITVGRERSLLAVPCPQRTDRTPRAKPLLPKGGPVGSKTRKGIYEQLLISGISEKGLQPSHIDLQENRMNLT